MILLLLLLLLLVVVLVLLLLLLLPLGVSLKQCGRRQRHNRAFLISSM
jgi:hypothetical protein